MDVEESDVEVSTVTPKPKRGRPKKHAGGLSRDRILDAATGLINRDGGDKVTMRGISVALGVDPMSLYNYFANKDTLLDAVALRFLDALPQPVPTGDLGTDVRALSTGFRESVAAQPHVAVLLLTRQLRSMTGLALTDAALGVLRTAGFSPDDAVRGFRSVVAFLVGTVLRESSVGPTFAAQNLGGLSGRQAELTSAGLHNVVDSADALAVLDHDREFEFGLEVLISGLRQHLEST